MNNDFSFKYSLIAVLATVSGMDGNVTGEELFRFRRDSWKKTVPELQRELLARQVTVDGV